ncbi:hypothetical protein D3C78_998530 [compost metagenome]
MPVKRRLNVAGVMRQLARFSAFWRNQPQLHHTELITHQERNFCGLRMSTHPVARNIDQTRKTILMGKG